MLDLDSSATVWYLCSSLSDMFRWVLEGIVAQIESCQVREATQLCRQGNQQITFQQQSPQRPRRAHVAVCRNGAQLTYLSLSMEGGKNLSSLFLRSSHFRLEHLVNSESGREVSLLPSK
jgi:hypothetical protein